MANAMKAEAEVSLEDGRKLLFAYDLNAFIDIGEELGKARGKDFTPDEIISVLQDKKNPPGLKFQRVLVWGGLRKHHPEMTIRDAGEVMEEAASAMERALNGGMPQAGEDSADDADANPPKRKNGRGTASTNAGAVLA